jgi:hypothetical protein
VTIVIVPFTVLNTMTLGDMTGTVSLAKILSEPASGKKPDESVQSKEEEVLKPPKKAGPSQEGGAL